MIRPLRPVEAMNETRNDFSEMILIAGVQTVQVHELAL